MENIPVKHAVQRLKISKLSIIAFSIFLSPIIPIMILIGLRVTKVTRFLSIQGLGYTFDIFLFWIVVSFCTSLILAILDLTKPKRLKILSIIIVATNSIIIGIGIFIVVLDLIRLTQ